MEMKTLNVTLACAIFELPNGPRYNSAPGFIINIPVTSLIPHTGHKFLANQVVCLEVAHGFRAKISRFFPVPDFDPNVSSALRSKCTSDCSAGPGMHPHTVRCVLKAEQSRQVFELS